MTEWIVPALIVVAIVLAVIAQKRGWVDFSDKHKTTGGGGGGMGALDEAFNPTRHEAQIELDRQTILPAPAPIAGDGDKGIFNGKVRIDLSDDRR
jgi:hypothetical protein